MLKEVHQCESTRPYFTVEVPSQSQTNLVYEVYSIFPDDPPEEYICSCQGFNFRGRCSHQDIAHADRCLWREGWSREPQCQKLKDANLCPRCGGSTYVTLEMIDD